LLYKSFEENNIDIIKYVFNNINYSNIDEISIDFDNFEIIISICVKRNFHTGIDFLFEWKNKHWNNFYNHHFKNLIKNIFQSNISINDFIEQTKELYGNYDNNSVNLMEIVISNIFHNNNLYLFDYIINKYKFYKDNMISALDDMSEFIFVDDNHLMLNKYIKFTQEHNNNNINTIYPRLYEEAIKNDRIKCFEFISQFCHLTNINDSNLGNILEECKFNFFNIVYDNNRKLFTHENLFELVKKCNDNENIKSINFLLNKFENLLEFILNNDPEYFFDIIFHTESENLIYLSKLLECFGNSKYIKLSLLLEKEKQIINIMYLFANDDNNNDEQDDEILQDSIIKYSIIRRIKNLI
jgi:hypothetical protein